jgi:hypothetical protein
MRTGAAGKRWRIGLGPAGIIFWKFKNGLLLSKGFVRRQQPFDKLKALSLVEG